MKPDYSYKVKAKVKKYIEKNEMLGHGDFVIVGLSGGADSVCLFLLLIKLQEELGFSIRAVHINHCIRGNSANRDEQFSKSLCEKYKVPFKSYSIDVPAIAKEKGLTLEEAGRNVRYSCFNQYASELLEAGDGISFESKVKIAVAHHMNDQAETVIFNIVRGSGLKGISGMNPVSDRNIIRPLLCLTKSEIIDYLSFVKQEYCTDETNLNNDYTRNSIRNVVIPELEKIQPRTSEHIAYMADEVREAVKYMECEAERLFKDCASYSNDNSEYLEAYLLDVKMLKTYNPIIVRQIIIYTLRRLIENYKDITRTHIEDISSLLTKGRGKYVTLPYNLIARREKEYIVIMKL